jgi:HSP20 family protein
VTRIQFERLELPDDLRHLFDSIRAQGDPSDLSGAAECAPPLDVVETDAGIDVLVDLPGVPAGSISVVFTRNVLMIAGQKPAPVCEHCREAAFHLAERTFGRFVRAVRLDGSFDAERAIAALSVGVLRISLPRIDDRRGREIRIPVRV